MIIVVNATAARESGALTILKQFVSNIVSNNPNSDKYYIFIDPCVIFSDLNNVVFIPIDTRSYISRIKWDYCGLKRWLKEHNILPNKIISFQNMGINFSEVPQIIYFHQVLPLEAHYWNPFSKHQRSLFLYKHFYSFFIKRYLTSHTTVVVQADWIKEKFASKFNFPKDRINVIRPQMVDLDTDSVSIVELDRSYTHFFYPATPLVYKNHIAIARAMCLLKTRGQSSNIKIHLTCPYDKSLNFIKLIEKCDLVDNFIFHDQMTFDQVLQYYKSTDGMLFPSYIETFGLPLIEAAKFGKPIVCFDLPYSREVLHNYSGVRYVKLNNYEKFAELIFNISETRINYLSLLNGSINEWGKLFTLIHQ